MARPQSSLPLLRKDEGYIVDEVQAEVRKLNDPTFRAEILQTQYGFLRGQAGQGSGFECIHICRTADGEEFVLDDSVHYW